MNESILWGGIAFVLLVALFFSARAWAKRDKPPRGSIPKEWL